MSDLQQALLDTLAAKGGGCQHKDLIALLGWDEEQYTAVRDELLKSGAVKKRRGRGGGIALPTYAESAPKVPKEKKAKLLPPTNGPQS